jgi:hypothetical protein
LIIELKISDIGETMTHRETKDPGMTTIRDTIMNTPRIVITMEIREETCRLIEEGTGNTMKEVITIKQLPIEEVGQDLSMDTKDMTIKSMIDQEVR